MDGGVCQPPLHSTVESCDTECKIEGQVGGGTEGEGASTYSMDV